MNTVLFTLMQDDSWALFAALVLLHIAIAGVLTASIAAAKLDQEEEFDV